MYDISLCRCMLRCLVFHHVMRCIRYLSNGLFCRADCGPYRGHCRHPRFSEWCSWLKRMSQWFWSEPSAESSQTFQVEIPLESWAVFFLGRAHLALGRLRLVPRAEIHDWSSSRQHSKTKTGGMSTVVLWEGSLPDYWGSTTTCIPLASMCRKLPMHVLLWRWALAWGIYRH